MQTVRAVYGRGLIVLSLDYVRILWFLSCANDPKRSIQLLLISEQKKNK